jgi:hypothetical protein
MDNPVENQTEKTDPGQEIKVSVSLNRYGRFRVPLPRNYDDIGFLLAIMRYTVVFDARVLPSVDMLEYLAYSSMFKALDSGEKVPWYQFTVVFGSGTTRVIVDMLDKEPVLRYCKREEESNHADQKQKSTAVDVQKPPADGPSLGQ